MADKLAKAALNKAPNEVTNETVMVLIMTLHKRVKACPSSGGGLVVAAAQL